MMSENYEQKGQDYIIEHFSLLLSQFKMKIQQGSESHQSVRLQVNGYFKKRWADFYQKLTKDKIDTKNNSQINHSPRLPCSKFLPLIFIQLPFSPPIDTVQYWKQKVTLSCSKFIPLKLMVRYQIISLFYLLLKLVWLFKTLLTILFDEIFLNFSPQSIRLFLKKSIAFFELYVDGSCCRRLNFHNLRSLFDSL